jgi:hypothetical protein
VRWEGGGGEGCCSFLLYAAPWPGLLFPTTISHPSSENAGVLPDIGWV